jgi:hypothetical protein
MEPRVYQRRRDAVVAERRAERTVQVLSSGEVLMSDRSRLVLPVSFAAVALVGCGGPTPSQQPCDPVAVMDAAILTYQCRDGRSCGNPSFQPDGAPADPYQVCPGTNECQTLVNAQGQGTPGFC